ncbi:MAG: hypothetical protein LBB45_04100 [Methanobrevibacter sp.]|jgi:ABC-type transporter Mla subunit MlaD|nr:hypothetical protein [Candidatus Methanovirga basalitermitum]
MSKKAKVEITATTNKNVKVGDKFGVNILAKQGSTSKGKSTGGNGGGKRKPKQPRMTINQLATIVEKQGTKLDQVVDTVDKLATTVGQLAIEMRAGFATVNKRIDKLEENDEKIFDILARNNLK